MRPQSFGPHPPTATTYEHRGAVWIDGAEETFILERPAIPKVDARVALCAGLFNDETTLERVGHEMVQTLGVEVVRMEHDRHRGMYELTPPERLRSRDI